MIWVVLNGAATCLLFRCRSIGKKRCCELGLWRLRRVGCGGFGCESGGKTAALHVDRAWRRMLRHYNHSPLGQVFWLDWEAAEAFAGGGEDGVAY